jgi:hypothetical protein
MFGLTKEEAEMLVLLSGVDRAFSFAEWIAAKHNLSSSYVSRVLRFLEIKGCVSRVKSGHRKLVSTVDVDALVEAKKVLDGLSAGGRVVGGGEAREAEPTSSEKELVAVPDAPEPLSSSNASGQSEECASDKSSGRGSTPATQ